MVMNGDLLHICKKLTKQMPTQKQSTPYTTSWGQSVLVQRKPGLKRLSMRFSHKQSVFMVSAPLRFPLQEIKEFIDGAKSWITKILDKQQNPQRANKTLAKIPIEPGQIIQLLGTAVTLEFIEGCRAKVVLKENILEVHGIRSKFEQQALSYLKKLANTKLTEYSFGSQLLKSVLKK
jgi:predicted metal-dependent hydrolase